MVASVVVKHVRRKDHLPFWDRGVHVNHRLRKHEVCMYMSIIIII